MEKWPPLAKPWDASQLLQPSVGKVYPKHLDLNPARNQKKNTFREKKLWPGKRKTMLLSFVESGDMKIYDPLAEDLYHEITCFTIGSCSFVDPQKGNFPVPESLKASGVLLEDRARCGSRSAESSSLTDFERVGGKQEATLTDGIYLFISFL